MMFNTIINFFKSNKTRKTIGFKKINEIIQPDKYSKFSVLGSGSSINEIEFQNKKTDEFRIAFNFFIYHSVVPDLYVFEIKPRDTSRFMFWCNLLKKRENEFKNVIFLIKDSEIDPKLNIRLTNKYFPPRLKKNLYFTHDKALIGRNFFHVKFSYFLSKFLFNDHIIKYRGSLTYVLSLIPDNKNVNLYGIDLDSNPHFWMAKNYHDINLPPLIIEDSIGSHLHRTVDPDFGAVSIDKFIFFQAKIKRLKINHINYRKINLSLS